MTSYIQQEEMLMIPSENIEETAHSDMTWGNQETQDTEYTPQGAPTELYDENGVEIGYSST